jgi:hypothetical protein
MPLFTILQFPNKVGTYSSYTLAKHQEFSYDLTNTTISSKFVLIIMKLKPLSQELSNFCRIPISRTRSFNQSPDVISGKEKRFGSEITSLVSHTEDTKP